MFDVFVFSQYLNCFIDIWCKNLVNIKFGFIIDDYWGFILFFCQFNGCGDGLCGSRCMRNNFNQWYFFDWVKKV